MRATKLRDLGMGSIFILIALTQVSADNLPRAEPEELGFSAERLNYIDEFYADKVKNGTIAGIVILVARHGTIAHFSAVGYADTESHKPMEKDNIFRFYSMTKPIAATALMMLYQEGKFQLDDPVSKYIPEFTGIRVLKSPDAPVTDIVSANREPTIHDLFRHTAGFLHGGAKPSINPIDEAYTSADLFNPTVSLQEMMRRLAKIPLVYQPGSKWNYSLVQDVQARLVEVLSGVPFDQFLAERLFVPLGMKDTSHWVRPESVARLVPVHWVKNGNVVPCDDGEGCSDLDVSEINHYTKNTVHKGGSSGLTGTAEDYWRFAQMMLDGGEFNGHRYLSPTTVRYMARNHLGTVAILRGESGESCGTGWGLGFAVVTDAASAGSEIPDGSFYWGGAANTLFWIDPKNDIVVVAMTQSMDSKLEDWATLREQIGVMVYAALTE
jgi:CubicO group peptidase (beta-lactamase class C family)